MQLSKPELKLLKKTMIESAAASYPCCLYCQIITKPTLQMVCGGCVTSLHKQFCMNKIKVYIMHIPSAAGWSFLRSVLYVRATSDAAKLTADSLLACSPQSSKNQSHVCVLTSKQVGKQFFYICTAIFPLQLTVQEACLLAPQNRPLSNITDFQLS